MGVFFGSKPTGFGDVFCHDSAARDATSLRFVVVSPSPPVSTRVPCRLTPAFATPGEVVGRARKGLLRIGKIGQNHMRLFCERQR